MSARQWRTSAIIGTAILLSPGQASPASPNARVFVPTSEWQFASNAESCWASREFADGDQRMQFHVQAFSPEPQYKLLLVGKALPNRSGGLLEFEMSFNPDRPREAAGILASSNGEPLLTLRSGLETTAEIEARRAAVEAGQNPAEDLSPNEAREAEVDELELAFSRGRPVALQLGSMKEPAARLRECAWQLVGQWGFDQAAEKDLSRRPVPIAIGEWLAPGTFPANYWRASLSALVHLRLNVDAQGKAADCVIQAPKEDSSAEVIACREIMKTARFEPALDRDGNPVPSYFTTSVFFVMSRRNGNT